MGGGHGPPGPDADTVHEHLFVRQGEIGQQVDPPSSDTRSVDRRAHPGARVDALLAACTDHAYRAMHSSTLLGIPGVLLLAWVLAPAASLTRRLILVVVVTAAELANFFVSGAALRARRDGARVHAWPGLVVSACSGASWALPALLTFPGSDHVALRATYLVFVCAVSATNVVSTAAQRSWFYALHAVMLTPICAVFLLGDDRTTRMLGFAVPVFLGCMVALHRDVERIVVSEIELRGRHEHAATELAEANRALTQRTRHDDLTGLANRVSFMEHLSRTVDAARRSGAVVGVLYFDLDRFKIVNDSLGHAVGDELLCQVALRVNDVLRGHDVFARLGGDEFTVCLDRLGDSYEAILVARRIVEVLGAPFEIDGRRIHVTASVGVATNLHRGDDAEALLGHADVAQYRAKEHGRNRVETFDIELRETIERRIDTEQALRDAIAANEITAWFQPLVDMHTGAVVGAEALARWVHPTRGLIVAPEFIPLAEESGLIFPIDARVVAQTVDARVRLASLGVAPEFRIWCNVSARLVSRGEPADRLAALLRRTGCDPRGIGIEITETAVLPDREAVARQITTLHEIGVECSLDDFGTGYSSLTLLQTLPIDAVKIDREFVRDLGIDPTDTAIVRSLVRLASDLGLDVVAEGVETQEQADLLLAMGCRYAQGYLWSPAVPLDELVTVLTREGHAVA